MATEPAATIPAKSEEPILLKTEPEPAPPEKTLFKTTLTVEEAKAAAIKELVDKQAADAAKANATAAPVTDTKTPDGKEPKAPDKAPVPSPTEYTLELPENSALTKEDLDATLKEAKEAGLSAEEAKEMLQSKDQTAKTAQTRLTQQQEQQLKTMVQDWKESVKKDPELGGEHLAETAIKASRAFKAVASPAMTEFLVKTGYIEHPELVRMMTKVYDLIGEDKFISGSQGVKNTAPSTMEEKAKKLFGNPIKEAVV